MMVGMEYRTPTFRWAWGYMPVFIVISVIRRLIASPRSFKVSFSVVKKFSSKENRPLGSTTEILNSGVLTLPASAEACFSGIESRIFSSSDSVGFILSTPDLKSLTESSPVGCNGHRMDDRGRGRESSTTAQGVRT